MAWSRLCAVGVALALSTSASVPPGTAGSATPRSPVLPPGSGAPAVLALPGGVVWDYDGSQILRSTDGGATWRAVLPTWMLTQVSLQVTGAFFLNADDAWAETEHEWPAQPGVTTTWQTTDGGATWHQGTSLPGAAQYGTAGFDEFAFADAKHGSGFGVAGASTSAFEQERQDSFWATSDGGRHWAEVAARGLPWEGSAYSEISAEHCDEPDPFNLTAVSASVVLLSGAGCPSREPGLWRSTDGGRTWAPVRLPPPPGGWAGAEAWRYPGVGENGAEVLALRFFAGGRGVAAVTTRPGQLLVYRSSDVGESWSLASRLGTGSLDRPSGFWASSPSAWELPAPAGLYVTTDGGGHWALESSGPSLGMAEVSFATPASGVGFAGDPEVGLASTGDSGMRTTDGGRSWEPVSFSAPAFLGNSTLEVPFGTVDFVNAVDGWVGGADGVAATTTGGSAWTDQLVTPEPVQELSFADAEHGWALTPDELFATSDGGAHWSATPEPALGVFSYVQLVTPAFGVGVICDQTGGTRVVAIDDEGRHWALLPVPQANELQCGTVPPSPGIISGVCFGTAQVGWAVLHGPAQGSEVVERSTDGGTHWSAVATVNFPPSAFTCQGVSAAWLGFTYGEHGGQGAVAGTTDGGRTWGTSARPVPDSAVLIPEVRPTDGTAVVTLGTYQSPAWVLEAPVGVLAAPSASTVVELWRQDSAGCDSGFGIALSNDSGTSWSGSPSTTTSPPPCGTTSLPYLGAVDYLGPSLSFPDPGDGFVLAPAAGTPALLNRPVEAVTMALVATTDAGHSWHLQYRFPGAASPSKVTPDQPIALAVSRHGDLYIGDRGRNEILEWVPSGRFRVVAGTGVAGLTGDGGPADRAEVAAPGSLVTTPDGTLYFTQPGRYLGPTSSSGGMLNTVVREIMPAGTIRTVAGLHPSCQSAPVRSVPAESALFYGASLSLGRDGDLAVGASLCVGDMQDQGFGPNLLLTSSGRFIRDASGPVPAVASVNCGSGVLGPGFQVFSCMSGGGQTADGHPRELLVVRNDGSSVAYPDYQGGDFVVGDGEVVATYNGNLVRVTSSRLVPLLTNQELLSALHIQPGADIGALAVGTNGDIYFVASIINRSGCQNRILERTTGRALRQIWGSSASRNNTCF